MCIWPHSCTAMTLTNPFSLVLFVQVRLDHGCQLMEERMALSRSIGLRLASWKNPHKRHAYTLCNWLRY